MKCWYLIKVNALSPFMGTIMIDLGLQSSISVFLPGVIQAILVIYGLSHRPPPEETAQLIQGLQG